MRHWKLLTLLGAVLLALLVSVWWERDVEHVAFDMYTEIWAELKSKRESHAEPLEWNSFVTKAEAKLRPIIDELESSDSSRKILRRELLWAGRDCMPEMLHASRSEPSKSELEFADHMDRARRLLAGEKVSINLKGQEQDRSTKQIPQPDIYP